MLRHLIEEEAVPAEEQCNFFHQLPNVTFREICHYVNTTKSCAPDDGFIDYLTFIYCTLADTSRPYLWPLLFCLVIVWLLFLLSGLALAADDFLCPTLTAIHRQLGLSENLVGVTFVAFGNGAPDIFGALAAIGGDRPEPGLAFGALFGAGIFVTTIVVGAIALIKPFHPMERPLLRDVIFYVIAVAWAYSLLYRSRVEIYDAVGFVVLYVIYAIVVIVGRRVNLHLRTRQYLPSLRHSVISVATSVLHPNAVRSSGVSPSDSAIIDAFQNGGWETGLDDSYPPAVAASLKNDNPTVSVIPAEVSFLVRHDDVDEPLLNYSVSSSSSGDDDDDDQPLLIDLRSSVNYARTHSNEGVDDALLNPSVVGVIDDSSQLTTATATANSMIARVDEKLEASSTWSSTIERLLCISGFEWKESGRLGKCVLIFTLPLRILFALTVPLVSYDEEERSLTGWNQLLFAVQLFLVPTSIVSILDLAARPVVASTSLPVIVIAVIVGFMAAVVVVACTNADVVPKFFFLLPFLGFGMSVLWIYSLADEIVGVLRAVGIVADIDAAVLGLTVLAWGNSIGDFITDCALAKAGNSRMALSACFAAPLFNTLLGFGIPFSIAIIQDGRSFAFERTDINAILIVTIAISLVFTLLWMVFTKFYVGRLYGIILIVLYLTFLCLSVLDLFDVIKSNFSVIIAG